MFVDATKIVRKISFTAHCKIDANVDAYRI